MKPETKPYPCAWCNGPIERRATESRSRWVNRTLCSRACQIARQKRRDRRMLLDMGKAVPR